jgi:predicted NBD/HSP70 family sugar kinase
MSPDGATGLVSGDVRRHNLTLVLEHLVRAGPSARSEISDATGLTRGSVTALAQVLVEAGILNEADPVGGSKGRPLTRLELGADRIALLAVQLAADEVTALLVTLSGDELYRDARPHGRPMGDPEAVLDVLAEVVRGALDAAAAAARRVADATVVVLAPVGGRPARVLGDITLGWEEVDVVGGLLRRVPALPADIVRLESDIPLAATAELAALRSTGDAVFIKGDSNIGGAMVVRGRVVRGAHGLGGSLGHVPIVTGGASCECGQHGCLVTVAGIDALLDAAGDDPRPMRQSPSAALQDFVGRVLAGDGAAVAAWQGAVPWIAQSLQIIAAAADPRVVVIGGHWARLTATIADAFQANRPVIAAAGTPLAIEVLAGMLGADAGLRGAVEAARDRLLDDPAALIKFNA